MKLTHLGQLEACLIIKGIRILGPMGTFGTITVVKRHNKTVTFDINWDNGSQEFGIDFATEKRNKNIRLVDHPRLIKRVIQPLLPGNTQSQVTGKRKKTLPMAAALRPRSQQRKR